MGQPMTSLDDLRKAVTDSYKWRRKGDKGEMAWAPDPVLLSELIEAERDETKRYAPNPPQSSL